jgi:hypothetical protein
LIAALHHTLLLRCSFNTPLWFDEQQLGELAGTTLAAATAARHASLARTWERLQPAVSSMLKQVGFVALPTCVKGEGVCGLGF